MYTVEPPNNGQVGAGGFVRYSDPLLGGFTIIIRCKLFNIIIFRHTAFYRDYAHVRNDAHPRF